MAVVPARYYSGFKRKLPSVRKKGERASEREKKRDLKTNYNPLEGGHPIKFGAIITRSHPGPSLPA